MTAETPTEYVGDDQFGRPWVRIATAHDGSRQVVWTCPTCMRGHYGIVGDVPVSGWEEPRWTVTEGPEGITLAPSLGCGGLRDGTCTGHWWFRDGKLVPA